MRRRLWHWIRQPKLLGRPNPQRQLPDTSVSRQWLETWCKVSCGRKRFLFQNRSIHWRDRVPLFDRFRRMQSCPLDWWLMRQPFCSISLLNYVAFLEFHLLHLLVSMLLILLMILSARYIANTLRDQKLILESPGVGSRIIQARQDSSFTK